MDRATIEEHLALAEQHVAEGAHHILSQQKIIADLGAAGHPTQEAKRLLHEFEALQGVHVAHRDRLQDALDDAAPPPQGRKVIEW